MTTMGVLLLAAATSTGGVFGGGGKAHAGGKRLLRAHAVVDGPAPPGGMIAPPVGPGGAGGPGGPGGPGGAGGPEAGRRFPNVRSQVFFVEPTGMRIGWQTAAGPGAERVYLPAQLSVPARYNFTQGYIYRLKVTDIAGRPGLVLYPTIEVAPSTPATDAYLTHNPIPAIFTEEDFDQVVAGNFVTKVIYLPDPRYQELAVAGVETLVSTRLEPGVDPILEADRRGTILMIMRIGAIDLEMPSAGASYAPAAAAGMNLSPTPTNGPVMTNPPGAPVGAPSAVPVTPAVPVDPAAPAAEPAALPATPPPPAADAPKPPDAAPAAPAPAADPAAPAAEPADPAAPADPAKPADPGVTPAGAPAEAPPLGG